MAAGVAAGQGMTRLKAAMPMEMDEGPATRQATSGFGTLGYHCKEGNYIIRLVLFSSLPLL